MKSSLKAWAARLQQMLRKGKTRPRNSGYRHGRVEKLESRSMLAGDTVPPLLYVDRPEGESVVQPLAPRKYDNDGDNFVAPLDALRIINWLNKHGAGPTAPAAPVATDIALESIYQGQSAQVDPFLANAVTDEDCDVVTILALDRQGAASVSVEGNVISITPDPLFSGDLQVEYQARDNDGVGIGKITVTVKPNQAPIANNLSFQIQTGVPYVLDIPKIDLDPGQLVRIDIATQPAHGTLVVNDNGTYTYTSGEGFAGSDAFTYRASDGIAASFATVTLTDSEFNNPPIAPDLSFDTNAGETFVVDVPRLDVDGDAVSISIETQPANGSVAQNADGTLAYTSNPSFSGTDLFTYRASDGKDFAIGTVTFNVIRVTPSADISVTLSGPSTAQDNDSIVYVATVTNHGPDVASGVTLHDAVPPGLTYVMRFGAPCNLDNTNVECLFDLVPGAVKSVDLTFTVNDDTSETLGTVLNQVAVVSQNATDPETSNNLSAAVTTTITNDAKECADGLDNDGNGKIDLLDPGCDSTSDTEEFFNLPPVDATPDGQYDAIEGVELEIPNRASDLDGDQLRFTISFPDPDLAINIDSSGKVKVTPIAGTKPRTDVFLIMVEDLRDLDLDGDLDVLSSVTFRYFVNINA